MSKRGLSSICQPAAQAPEVKFIRGTISVFHRRKGESGSGRGKKSRRGWKEGKVITQSGVTSRGTFLPGPAPGGCQTAGVATSDSGEPLSEEPPCLPAWRRLAPVISQVASYASHRKPRALQMGGTPQVRGWPRPVLRTDLIFSSLDFIPALPSKSPQLGLGGSAEVRASSRLLRQQQARIQ